VRIIIVLVAIALMLTLCSCDSRPRPERQQSKSDSEYDLGWGTVIKDWKDPKTGCSYIIVQSGNGAGITPAIGRCQPA
jgi:hypothetical protein